MFDLSRPLKDELVLDNTIYQLDLSFSNVLKFFELMQDDDIPDDFKPLVALKLLTGVKFNNLTQKEAIEIIEGIFKEHIQIKDFEENRYDLQGNLMPVSKATDGTEEDQVFSLKHDGEYIFASFMQAYNIDLIDVQKTLHWKKFNALLSGLPKDTKMMEVIGYRTWRPQKGDSTRYKEQMRKLQKEYALPKI